MSRMIVLALHVVCFIRNLYNKA